MALGLPQCCNHLSSDMELVDGRVVAIPLVDQAVWQLMYVDVLNPRQKEMFVGSIPNNH